jgi:hypothetical protein
MKSVYNLPLKSIIGRSTAVKTSRKGMKPADRRRRKQPNYSILLFLPNNKLNFKGGPSRLMMIFSSKSWARKNIFSHEFFSIFSAFILYIFTIKTYLS